MNLMLQTRSRRFALYAMTIVTGILVSCVILAAIGYNSNQNLPVGPQVTDRMESLDKLRLAEALHLKIELGDAVWPGYATLNAPVIIWNKEYEFLFGMNAPPPDWEQVPGDDFQGNEYFRRPADDPQNFAVLVEDQWVASVFTKHQLDASLINGVRDLLPPVISEIFPYQIFIQPSEFQISGVQHEYFHVVQALSAPDKFASAEAAYELDGSYWLLDEEMQPAWGKEIELLIKAVETSSDDDAAEFARQFLTQRDQRRQDFGLNADQIAYEVLIEWLEGTAKYVELRSWEVAGLDPNYLHLLVMETDPDFKDYEDFEGQWKQALRQTRRQGGVEGDVRFYYTGMLQSFLLDRLIPSWKERSMEEGVDLESLLREAIAK